MKAKIISQQPLSKKSWFNKIDWFECKPIGSTGTLFVLFDGKHNDGRMFLKSELEIIEN